MYIFLRNTISRFLHHDSNDRARILVYVVSSLGEGVRGHEHGAG